MSQSSLGAVDAKRSFLQVFFAKLEFDFFFGCVSSTFFCSGSESVPSSSDSVSWTPQFLLLPLGSFRASSPCSSSFMPESAVDSRPYQHPEGFAHQYSYFMVIMQPYC